jgi:Kef-type K+ transport system membrane component KefB
MNKLQTSAAKAVIGAAVIDDVLALLALSLSEQITSGTLSLSFILITAAKAIGFIAIGALLGKLLLARLLVRFDRTRIANKYPESIFIFAIMVSFLYAMGADLVGLSAIVGSFLAGVSFSGITLKKGKIFHEGAEHLRIIFASIFFISLGVLLDLHAINLNLIYFILALTVVAAITKIIGCGLPAKLGGLDFKDSLIVGVGMMPRGEVAMIVALIGLNQNLIEQNVYAALILMSLLTTVIPPLILRNYLFKLK